MADDTEDAINELNQFPVDSVTTIQQAPQTQRPDTTTEPATTAGNDATTTAQEISDEQADVLGELDDLEGALGAL